LKARRASDLAAGVGSPIFAALQKDLQPLGVTLDLSRAAAQPLAPERVNLTGLSRPALAAALVEAGVAAPQKARMRASQACRWIHH
jgi:hypothetical protein